MKDMLHQPCEDCEFGEYRELSLWDDWDGTVTCTHCERVVERWAPDMVVTVATMRIV